MPSAKFEVRNAAGALEFSLDNPGGVYLGCVDVADGQSANVIFPNPLGLTFWAMYVGLGSHNAQVTAIGSTQIQVTVTPIAPVSPLFVRPNTFIQVFLL